MIRTLQPGSTLGTRLNPSLPTLVNPKPQIRIGLDLGGTKIEAIALSAQGEELYRKRVSTPVGDYQATLEAMVALVREIESRLDAQGCVGVATPGSLSPTSRLIRNSNSLCLNGQPLDVDLERLLGRPIRLANDADCFTLSEAVDGAGQGYDNVFGVIIGTGTGGGLVIKGNLVCGPNRTAGEWGHNPLPWMRQDEYPGPLCYCGQRGCIETFLSGPGLARDHARHGEETLTAEEIANRADAGHPAAIQSLRRYEDRLARALASIINVLDPEVIVLGGGLSKLPSLYTQVPPLMADYVFSDSMRSRLLPPKHGDSSGVRGAAWLWDIPPARP